MSKSQTSGDTGDLSVPRGRVIGIGGVFFKAERPHELTAWYEKHLGFHADPRIGVTFPWKHPADSTSSHRTTWAVFPKDTSYFGPSGFDFMLNYIVDDLDGLLARLKAEGVRIDPKRETDEAGRFAWIYDSSGNKIELWEPVRSL